MSDLRKKLDRDFPLVRGNMMDALPIDAMTGAPDVDGIKKSLAFPTTDPENSSITPNTLDAHAASVASNVMSTSEVSSEPFGAPVEPDKKAAVSLLTGILNNRYIDVDDKQQSGNEVDKAAFPALRTALNIASPLLNSRIMPADKEKVPKLFSGLELKRDGSYSAVAVEKATIHGANSSESAGEEYIPTLFSGVGKIYSDSGDELYLDENGNITSAPDVGNLFELIDQYEADSRASSSHTDEQKPKCVIPVDPYNSNFNYNEDYIALDDIPELPKPTAIKLEPHKGD